MSIPLDNLYHWIEGLLPRPAVLYVFRPHGSKEISNCSWLREYDRHTVYRFPGIIINDQEPLNWDFYNSPQQYLNTDRWKRWRLGEYGVKLEYCCNFNLQSVALAHGTIYDQVILIHSEKNSIDLEKYQQNGFICVHHWAHAVIARDWYRFAQFDIRLTTKKQPQKTFLIYSRDWSHRREYRLKFLEMLIENNLDHVSQTGIMHNNSDGAHFLDYEFSNPKFKLNDPQLINCIPINTVSSASSADYDYTDIISTQISVVLETVFDDSRIHLTEKTLRPIACGHPFILAAGTGALDYIRSYGFKTFSPWIDESYDQEPDSLIRMEKIIKSMQQIQNLQGQDREDFNHAIKNIAEFNKQHFFSNEFFNSIESELKNNLDWAYSLVKRTKGKHHKEMTKLFKKNHLNKQWPQRQEKIMLVRQLRQSCLPDPSNPGKDSLV
jgi:hypothetical protein